MTTRFRWFLTVTSLFSGISIAGVFFAISVFVIERFCPSAYAGSQITCDMEKPIVTCAVPWMGELRWIALAISATVAVVLTVAIPAIVAPTHKRRVALGCLALVALPLFGLGYGLYAR